MPQNFTEETIDKTFGVSNKVLKSYIEREGVDDRFIEALKTSKIVVIHGSSKQGKTSLWKHHTDPTKTLQLNCGTIDNITSLHTQILRKAGFTIDTKVVANEITPQIGGSINIFGINAEAGASGSHSTSTESISLEINPTDANNITDALVQLKFKGTFIIDDFHYLDAATQEAFTKTLKTFYDTDTLDVTFVIVGVWKETNRLEVYNGDLAGRIRTINADAWNNDQLTHVISRGEELLNITFDHEFKKELVYHCEGAVYLLQSACRTACINHLNSLKQANTAVNGNALELISNEITLQSARYERFITAYSEDDRSQKHHIRKWIIAILAAYIRSSEDRKYVTRDELTSALDYLHPSISANKGSMISNLGRTLNNVAQRQNDKKVAPPVLSYDENARRLNVVDLSFMIWLRKTDLSLIDEALSLPANDGNIRVFMELLFDA